MVWHTELLGQRRVGSPRPPQYNNTLSTLEFSKLVSINFLKDKKKSFLPGKICWSKEPPSPCDPLSVGSGGEGRAFSFDNKGGEQGYSDVVRELASYQCGPGSNPGVDAICVLSLLLVSPLLREVFLQVLQFSSRLKNQHFHIPTRFGTHGHVSTSSYELLSAPWVNKLHFQLQLLQQTLM